MVFIRPMAITTPINVKTLVLDDPAPYNQHSGAWLRSWATVI
jgi:hypothetical protein